LEAAIQLQLGYPAGDLGFAGKERLGLWFFAVVAIQCMHLATQYYKSDFLTVNELLADAVSIAVAHSSGCRLWCIVRGAWCQLVSREFPWIVTPGEGKRSGRRGRTLVILPSSTMRVPELCSGTEDSMVGRFSDL
jgi:hypothetical protein